MSKETETMEPEIIEKHYGTGGEEIPERETEEENTGSDDDELENDFANFRKTKSTHEIPKEEKPEASNDFIPDNVTDADDFKIKMFTGIFFMIVDELHVFLYNFFSKHKLTRDDIGLDEDDRDGLNIYFKTKKVMDFINRLSPEVMGLIHMEWLYYNKFKEFTDRKKLEEKKEEEQEEEEEEESDDNQEEKTERKAPVKKRKKKKRKPSKNKSNGKKESTTTEEKTGTSDETGNNNN